MTESNEFLDLPEQLRGPAQTHGRDMVALVYGAGMASEAMKVLAKHQKSPDVSRALVVLSNIFNETSTAYCKTKGWTEEMLAMCDRDISLSFAAGIVTPRKIILEH